MTLRADHAISDRVLRVDAGAKVAEIIPEVRRWNATHVAVFSDEQLLGVARLLDVELAADDLTVRDLGEPTPCPAVPATGSLDEIGRRFADCDVNIQTVHDDRGEYIGAVTRQSLIETLLKDRGQSGGEAVAAGHDGGSSESTAGDAAAITDHKLAGEALRTLVAASSRQSGESFFESMALELSRVLQADYTLIGELDEGDRESVRTLAAVADGELLAGFNYNLADTPCAHVVGRRVCSFPANVTDQFPNDVMLKHMSVEGYVGAPLFGATGGALGIMVAMFRAPIANAGFTESILQIFSARVGSEIERKRYEDALRESRERLNLAMQGTSDGLWDWGIETGQEYWSPDFKKLLGYAEDEITPSFEAFLTHLHPDDRFRAVQAIQSHLEDRQTYDVELRLRCENGEFRWFQSRGEALRDGDGKPYRMVGSIRDIHDRKQAEEDLKQSEEKFRTLTDEIPVSVSIIQDNRRVFTNKWARDVTGYSPEELLQLEPGRLLDRESHVRYEQMVDDCYRAGTTSRAELRGHDKLGRERWIDYSIARIEYNRRQALLGVSIDITGRKLAEEALKKSEHRFRSVFEQAGIAMGIVESQSGRFLKVNNRYASLLGYTNEELAQKTWMDLTHPADLDDALERTHDLRDGTVGDFSAEKRLVHRDGSSIWINLTVSPIRNSSDKPGQHIVIVENITDRKIAEVALRRSERQLRTISDNVPVMIGYVDSDLRYQYVNKRYEEFYGLPREKIVGRHLREMLGDDTFDRILENFEQVLRGEQVNFEQTVDLPLRNPRNLVVSCVPDVANDLQVRGFYAVIADDTQRKQAEEQLTKLRDQLAHLGRISAMGEMATGLAHELNQPLAAIANYCYSGSTLLADSSTVDGSKLSEILDKMSAQALRSGSIIRRMRELVRKVPTVRSATDVARLIQKSFELMEPDLRQREVDLKMNLADPAPPAMVDSIQIQQVVVNLVRNALDAMDHAGAGDRELTISMSTNDDGAIEVAVCDTGNGISPENADDVFEAFYTTKPEGMGMGLAICRSIIESHNGLLWATPNAEHGTTFHFTVPIAKGEHLTIEYQADRLQVR